ncbi:MAG: ATP-binding cassette domain-containing protein [Coriobacteriia bacterium]|nr:ATP-binding cassette domain-containing protein [Coriobacteriia bacterium]
MILEAHNLSFCYHRDAPPVLHDINLSLSSNERVGLAAPSGSGKTTLCRLLAGYERPATGEILLDGEPLYPKRRHLRSNAQGHGRGAQYAPVQMIWQHPEMAVNPRLRMRETIAEGGLIEPRVLHGLGIKSEWMNRFPGELSGGELQRFCIARSLGEQTKFLLADEITTMLDLITQAQIWSFLLDEVQMRDIGLLVVSHSEALLRHVCTRTHTLDATQSSCVTDCDATSETAQSW